jgi:hypothetical protein
MKCMRVFLIKRLWIFCTHHTLVHTCRREGGIMWDKAQASMADIYPYGFMWDPVIETVGIVAVYLRIYGI